MYLFPLDIRQLPIAPLRVVGCVQGTHISRQVRPVADTGGTLFGEQGSVLFVVVIVAPLKTGGSGEFGFLHHIIERNFFMHHPVPGEQAGAVEPPFVATEDQVRIGYIADGGGAGAVALGSGNGEGLGRHQATETSPGGVVVIVMQQVGVVHGLRPAPEVIVVQLVPQGPGGQGLTHVLVEIRAIEGFISHSLFPSLRGWVPPWGCSTVRDTIRVNRQWGSGLPLIAAEARARPPPTWCRSIR